MQRRDHEETAMTDAADERTRRHVVKLPWGKAVTEEEVAVAGGGGGERPIQVGIARLRTEEGEDLLRFFYRSADRIVRGPLTLRAAELDELAAALREVPSLHALVRRLAGGRR
jgi:hypothetical protein